jgi:hypothetical protein
VVIISDLPHVVCINSSHVSATLERRFYFIHEACRRLPIFVNKSLSCACKFFAFSVSPIGYNFIQTSVGLTYHLGVTLHRLIVQRCYIIYDRHLYIKKVVLRIPHKLYARISFSFIVPQRYD